MKTKQLMIKYKDVLASISEANKDDSKNWQPDLGVALDMLKHELYAYKGIFGRTHQYEGIPKDFDFDEFSHDIDPDAIE